MRDTALREDFDGINGIYWMLLYGAVRDAALLKRCFPTNGTNFTNLCAMLLYGDGVYLFVSQARQSNARHAGILKNYSLFTIRYSLPVFICICCCIMRVKSVCWIVGISSLMARISLKLMRSKPTISLPVAVKYPASPSVFVLLANMVSLTVGDSSSSDLMIFAIESVYC